MDAPISISPPFLYRVGETSSLARLGVLHLHGDRSLFRPRRRTTRLSTRRELPNHIRSRTIGLDVIIRIYRNGRRFGDRSYMAYQASQHSCHQCRSYWCIVHLLRFSYRRALGETYVGHLLGVGRSTHVGTHSSLFIPWHHWTAQCHRRPEDSSARRVDLNFSRSGEHTHHSLLSRMV